MAHLALTIAAAALLTLIWWRPLGHLGFWSKAALTVPAGVLLVQIYTLIRSLFEKRQGARISALRNLLASVAVIATLTLIWWRPLAHLSFRSKAALTVVVGVLLVQIHILVGSLLEKQKGARISAVRNLLATIVGIVVLRLIWWRPLGYLGFWSKAALTVAAGALLVQVHMLATSLLEKPKGARISALRNLLATIVGIVVLRLIWWRPLGYLGFWSKAALTVAAGVLLVQIHMLAASLLEKPKGARISALRNLLASIVVIATLALIWWRPLGHLGFWPKTWLTVVAAVVLVQVHKLIRKAARKRSQARVASVRALKDQAVLSDIATKDSDPELRAIAASRLSDQSVLADIARSDSEVDVRLAAVKALTDEGALAKIARNGKGTALREAAIAKLNDASVLAEIAKNADETSAMRQTAINRLTDKAALEEIAAKAEQADLRIAAVAKLTDETVLSQIAGNDREGRVRVAALKRLTDQSSDQAVLNSIAQNDDAPLDVRTLAAKKAGDSELLAGLRALAKWERAMKQWKRASKPETRGTICDGHPGVVVEGEDNTIRVFLGPECKAARKAVAGSRGKNPPPYICAASLAALHKVYPDGRCAKCKGYHIQSWEVSYSFPIPGKRGSTGAELVESWTTRFVDAIHQFDDHGCFTETHFDQDSKRPGRPSSLSVTCCANTQWLCWSCEAFEAAYVSLGGAIAGTGAAPRKPEIARRGGSAPGRTDKGGPSPSQPKLELCNLAFLITPDGAELPEGEGNAEREAFLPRLRKGREDAVQFRRDWLANAAEQAAEQGFPGVTEALFKDPVDEQLPGWYSLAILFDWDRMDSDYGIPAFRLFFERVDPDALESKAIVHFGDLVQFETMCAIMIRSKAEGDLTHVAERFGPDLEAEGLLPHAIRFLRADRSDGHLIARTFSLPVTAELRKGRAIPDPQASADGILEEAVKGTPWRKS